MAPFSGELKRLSLQFNKLVSGRTDFENFRNKYWQFFLLFKALSIAQPFIVVRLQLPVHRITAPYKQKYTSFKLVREPVSGVYAHNCTGYCESNLRAIVKLMYGAYIHHCRDCHAVMRKYSAYTEAEMLYTYICYIHTEAGLALFSTISTLI